MTAFRFAGCRHPVPVYLLAATRDETPAVCPQCGELRTVREVESVRDLAPRRPTGVTPDQPAAGGRLSPEDVTRRVANAAGKGQVALLVVDAQGVVVVGLKAIGGLTELRYVPGEGIWRFAGALSGQPEVMDGSYALRNALGTERTPERFEPEPGTVYTNEQAREEAARQLERHRPELGPGVPEPIEDFGRPPPPR